MSIKDIKKYSTSLTKIHSIGPYIARKALFDFLSNDKSKLISVIDTLKEINEKFQQCRICNCWDVESPCSICSSSDRYENALCLIETSVEMWHIEETKSFHGRYLVLGDNALNEIDMYSSYVEKIQQMITSFDIKEILIAFRNSPESGVATHYFRQSIKDVKFSHIGYGMSVSSSVEYTDKNTLGIAMKNRISYK